MKKLFIAYLFLMLPVVTFAQWTGSTGTSSTSRPNTTGVSSGLSNWKHSNVGIGINQYSFGLAQVNFGLSTSAGKKWYFGRWASDRIGLGFSFDYANVDFAFGENQYLMQFGQALGLNLSVNLTNSVYLDFNSHFLGYEVGFGTAGDLLIHGGYFSQYNPIIRFDNFYIGPAIHYGFGGYNLPEDDFSGDYGRMAILLKIGFVKF
jgi:hypothetical protein